MSKNLSKIRTFAQRRAVPLTVAGALLVGGGVGAGIHAAVASPPTSSAPVSAEQAEAIAANAVTQHLKAVGGYVEVTELPAGVDRFAANAAEADGNVFVYRDSAACGALTVRFPDRRVVAVTGDLIASGQGFGYGVAPRSCTTESATARWVLPSPQPPAEVRTNALETGRVFIAPSLGGGLSISTPQQAYSVTADVPAEGIAGDRITGN